MGREKRRETGEKGEEKLGKGAIGVRGIDAPAFNYFNNRLIDYSRLFVAALLQTHVVL